MWDELQEVVRRYRTAGEGEPDAIRVLVWTYLLPMDEDNPQEDR